jgi:hypothetical protein
MVFLVDGNQHIRQRCQHPLHGIEHQPVSPGSALEEMEAMGENLPKSKADVLNKAYDMALPCVVFMDYDTVKVSSILSLSIDSSTTAMTPIYTGTFGPMTLTIAKSGDADWAITERG